MEISPESFENHLSQLGGSPPFLVAVSGGVDSMVLLHLMNQLTIPCSTVHCNFQLRGESAKLDAQFVENQSKIYKIKYYVKEFSTLEYAEQHQLSIQEAARNLRYQWFEELLQTTEANHLLTAHHLDDHLETILWHLARGTGLKGLLGIPSQRGPFLRPLLPYPKEEIKRYAHQHQITYREDLSNQEDKYKRNFIRHHIVPPFKKLNENWAATLGRTLQQLKGAHEMQQWAIQQWALTVSEPLDGEMVLHWNRQKLAQSPSPFALLNQALAPLGFNTFQVNEILSHSPAQHGLIWTTKSHQLFLQKQSLVVLPHPPSKMELEWHELHKPLIFQEGTLKEFPQPHANMQQDNKYIEFFDLDQLQLPLKLRYWKEGDYFYPIGMGGGKQKLKKFFNNERVPTYAKKNVPLLVNGNGQILWVVGYRMDERFKITNQTQNTIGLVFQPKNNSQFDSASID